VKAGRLFEQALKNAGIDLRTGTELKVQVKEKGDHLRLGVSSAKPSEFEAQVLARSRNAIGSKAAYQPELSVGETIRDLRKAAGLTLGVPMTLLVK
jgi:hypothetical protein